MEKCNLRPAAPILLSNRTHGQFACQLPRQITRDTAAQPEIRISLEPRAAPRLANRLPNCDDPGRPCRLRSLRGYCRNWGNRPGSQRRRPDASARPSGTGTSPALRSSELGPEADREIADCADRSGRCSIRSTPIREYARRIPTRLGYAHRPASLPGYSASAHVLRRAATLRRKGASSLRPAAWLGGGCP